MNTTKTLREYLEACRTLGVDKDIYVDGIDGIAYCGTELTPEGEKVFAEALELPMEGCYVVSPDNDDYDLIGERKGRLWLAWELISGMAGYCSCEDWDRWFTDGEEE